MSFCGRIIIVVFFSTCDITNSQQNLVIDLRDFTNGNFKADVSSDLVVSSGATDRLLQIGDAIIHKGDDFDKKFINDDETAIDVEVQQKEYYELQRYSVERLLRFASEEKNTEASLTAILIAAKLCETGDKKTHEAGIKMLNELILKHPQRWQGAVATLVKGSLLYLGDPPRTGAQRGADAKPAVQHLVQAGDLVIPLDSPEVKMFLRFNEAILESPVRVNALMFLAICEVDIASDPVHKADGPRRYAEARRLYRQIIDEYPETRLAEKARQGLDTIVALEELETLPKISGQP